jgi:hypothetical protein
MLSFLSHAIQCSNEVTVLELRDVLIDWKFAVQTNDRSLATVATALWSGRSATVASLAKTHVTGLSLSLSITRIRIKTT